ncbi:unnamed protein product [Soboliphyme baturini]|uniref:Uncharacterized protein n=1 Tax=Soboliphyme baturini TaxID=241478 RepID=A0A183ICT8_9BILA|nr:unnamed protein product [Soboliphyme baturini]
MAVRWIRIENRGNQESRQDGRRSSTGISTTPTKRRPVFGPERQPEAPEGRRWQENREGRVGVAAASRLMMFAGKFLTFCRDSERHHVALEQDTCSTRPTTRLQCQRVRKPDNPVVTLHKVPDAK